MVLLDESLIKMGVATGDMNVYDIYIPDVNIYVKFKVLGAEELQTFVQDNEHLESITYKRIVLENFVFNLKPEIIEALDNLEDDTSERLLQALYNACVQLNPVLDIEQWLKVAFSATEIFPFDDDDDALVPPPPQHGTNNFGGKKEVYDHTKIKPAKFSKTKFANLKNHLTETVIGQPEACKAVVDILRRSQANLNDPNRPLGVVLLAGASGVGKSLLAKTLQDYLFDKDSSLVRIDCGEYQHKHENQKLLGAPQGYLGYGNGGILTNAVMENPNTVVLLDEVEKAHPDLWDTFLRIFDEGLITDSMGNIVSFRNCIIIMTTNLGNDKIVSSVSSASTGFSARINVKHNTIEIPKRDIVIRESLDAIKKHFKPEFLNRIDDIIVFNHLTSDDFEEIAEIELLAVDKKLTRRGISLRYDESVISGLIELGIDSTKGARGLAQVRRDMIENLLADVILGDEKTPRGSIFNLTYKNGEFQVVVRKPQKKAKTTT